MAAKKKSKTNVPAGFAPVRSQMGGFFIVEEGNQLQGILRDKFVVRTKFGPKNVFKVEVTSADPATRIIDKESGERDAEVGELIGLDEKGYLKMLGDMPKGIEVLIRCTGKEEKARVKGQSPAWVFEVFAATGEVSDGDAPIS